MGKRKIDRDERQQEKLDRKEKREENKKRTPKPKAPVSPAPAQTPEPEKIITPAPPAVQPEKPPVHIPASRPASAGVTPISPVERPAPQITIGPNPFIQAVEAVQGKIDLLKDLPALGGPQVKHALQSVSTYLNLALTETRSSKPQAGRIHTPIENAVKAIEQVVGQSPMLVSVKTALAELSELAKKTFPG